MIYDDLMNYNIGKYDPAASFNYIAAVGNSITFNNLSDNATTYEWDFGDGNTSTAIAPVHTYAAGGNYTVTLIAYHCNDTDTTYQVINTTPTSIDQLHSTNSLNIYPNPFTDLFSIEIQQMKVETLSILNCTGQTVFVSDKALSNRIDVDFSKFSAGIYFIVVNAEGKVFSQKIIKQ